MAAESPATKLNSVMRCLGKDNTHPVASLCPTCQKTTTRLAFDVGGKLVPGTSAVRVPNLGRRAVEYI